MPNLKNYPARFNPYGHNLLPPQISYLQNKRIFSKEIGHYENFEMPPLQEGQSYYIDGIDTDDYIVTLTIIERATEYNKNYESQLAEYNKKLEEWKILKARWDKEVAEEQESKEYKDYLKLKKKYEK